MKFKYLLSGGVFALSLLVSVKAAAEYDPETKVITATFDWTNPKSLMPAYDSPTAENRDGAKVGGVDFFDSGVSFWINDNDVKEQSRKARFYFGYNTQRCELRIYMGSSITIGVAAQCIQSVTFEGTEVGEDYMTAQAEGSWSGSTWTMETPSEIALFDIDARCQIARTIVKYTFSDGVDDILVDETNVKSVWYDLSGRALKNQPDTPGVYVEVRGAQKRKVFVK